MYKLDLQDLNNRGSQIRTLSEEEIREITKGMKNNESAETNGILAEVIKIGGEKLIK